MLRDKQPLALAPREMAFWTAAVLAVCVWVWAAHLDPRVQSGQGVGAAPWRLDLNSASAGELEMLPGIGPHRARLIVDERHRRGAFETVWQLARIRGLSRALVHRIEPLTQVRSPAPDGASTP